MATKLYLSDLSKHQKFKNIKFKNLKIKNLKFKTQLETGNEKDQYQKQKKGDSKEVKFVNELISKLRLIVTRF